MAASSRPGAPCASAGVAHLDVTRRPRIGVFSGGDELAEPGGVASCDQIFEAGSFAICGLIDHWGGQARRLPIVRDSAVAVAEAAASAQRHADLLVIIGGASVGPHDHARSALRGLGVEIAFDKIAVRPGKPTWFGVSPAGPVLGLPGNPASAIMCARLLLRPLVEKMLARNAADAAQQRVSLLMAPLGAGLPGNGARESYLRGHLDERGVLHQFDDQDSSLLSVFAKTNTLIVRPANAAAACAGDIVGCLSFP